MILQKKKNVFKKLWIQEFLGSFEEFFSYYISPIKYFDNEKFRHFSSTNFSAIRWLANVTE